MTEYAVLMITRRCNMSCGHCSVESHPGIKGQPDEEKLRSLVRELAAVGVDSIQFTGGEPLIRRELLLELMNLAKQLGVRSSIISNGFWGKKKDKARDIFVRMREAGLARLAISYDRFHAEFMGPEPVLNIIEIAREFDFPIHLNVTRTLDDRDLTSLLEPFQSASNLQFRIYDVQPVGKAKELDNPLRANLSGFCSGCEQPTVTDDGRLIACNGPAYFEGGHSNLIVGSLADDSVASLIQRHAEDPILETIRLSGPLELKRILQSLPGPSPMEFKQHYSGMCELCQQINSNPQAVAALKEYLNTPEQRALLLARGRSKRASRENTLNREYVNTRGAARAFYLLATNQEKEFASQVSTALGRADLDWAQQLEFVKRNRLCSRLSRKQSLLTDYAPHFFLHSINQVHDFREATSLQQIAGEWQKADFGNLLESGVRLHELALTLVPKNRLERALVQSALQADLLEVGAWSQSRSGVDVWTENLCKLSLAMSFSQRKDRINSLFLPLAQLLAVTTCSEIPRAVWRFTRKLHSVLRSEPRQLLKADASELWQALIRFIRHRSKQVPLTRVENSDSLNPMKGEQNYEVRST